MVGGAAAEAPSRAKAQHLQKPGKKEEGHVVLCPSGIEEDGPCKTLLVRTGSGGSRGGVADGVAVDHELDAAVALAAFRGLVGGDGLGFAETAGCDGRRRYALFSEKFAHGTGAALGKLLIEFVAADAVGVAFDLKHEAGMRENDAGNFREFFARAGLERVAAGVKENIRHIDDEAAGGVAGLQNGIQLREELRAKLTFFGFGLRGGLARSFGVRLGGGPVAAGLCGVGLRGGSIFGSLLGFGLGGLLLREGGSAGLIGFLFLTRSFLSGLLGLLLHALGVGFGGFGLLASLIGFLAAPAFGFGVGTGSDGALLSSSLFGGDSRLGVVFGLLFYGHDASFLGCSNDFASGGFHGFPVAALRVSFFQGSELLFGLGDHGRGVFVGKSDVRDAHGVARFKNFKWRLAVDAKDGVLDFGVGGRIDAAAEKLVAGVDVFDFAERGRAENVFEDHGVAGLRDREIRLGSDDHAEGLHVGDDGLDLSAASFQNHFAEVHGAAPRRDSPENVGQIFEAKLGGFIEA